MTYHHDFDEELHRMRTQLTGRDRVNVTTEVRHHWVWRPWFFVPLLVLACLVGLWLSPGRAHGVMLEEPFMKPDRWEVTYTEPTHGTSFYWEVSNGATFSTNRIKACAKERYGYRTLCREAARRAWKQRSSR